MLKNPIAWLTVLLASTSATACSSSTPASANPSGAGPRTYQVSVDVSGLLGSGLVLTLNGGDDLSVTPNGVAKFSAQVPNGGAYSIGVKHQPVAPQQNCVARYANGIVSEANPAPVDVVCTTVAFPIAVSVWGLTQSGLVLQDNGGDDLSVSEQGTVFAKPVSDQASYNVTIRSQPAGQTCVIVHGSGTVNGQSPTGIAVAC